jgi:hypothetical protein
VGVAVNVGVSVVVEVKVNVSVKVGVGGVTAASPPLPGPQEASSNGTTSRSNKTLLIIN